MKTNKIKTLVFIGLFSICSISCSGKPNSYPQSPTEQNDTLQTNSIKNKSTTTTTSKDSDDDFFSMLLLYVSLGLNTLVICVLIKQHLRQNRQSAKIEKIRSYLKAELNKNNNHAQNTAHRVQQVTSLSTYDVNRLISKYLNDSNNLGPILDSIRELQRLDEQEKERVHTQLAEHQNGDSSKSILYASSPEAGKTHFYSVISSKDPEKTIFELHVTNGNYAEYKVTQSAFRIVLTDQSFLEAACDLTKKGSSNFINEENGIAEKQSDGKWLITKKAKVTIE